VDLDSFLVSLYVLVDDRWKADHPSTAPRKPGRPARISESEVLTLAILAQWPRFRSEREFWRFASSHLRSYWLFAATRAMLGAGVGLLVADKLGEDERKVIGWTLFLMGVVSTVPLVRDIFSKLR
jgi:hypothetical protein